MTSGKSFSKSACLFTAWAVNLPVIASCFSLTTGFLSSWLVERPCQAMGHISYCHPAQSTGRMQLGKPGAKYLNVLGFHYGWESEPFCLEYSTTPLQKVLIVFVFVDAKNRLRVISFSGDTPISIIRKLVTVFRLVFLPHPCYLNGSV